jgi:hypothetical protein
MDDRHEIEEEIFARQCEVLDRIVMNRRWRRGKLAELPVSEVGDLIRAETGGKSPAADLLGSLLRRYLTKDVL